MMARLSCVAVGLEVMSSNVSMPITPRANLQRVWLSLDALGDAC